MHIRLKRSIVGRKPGQVFHVLMKVVSQYGTVRYLVGDIELHAQASLAHKVLYVSPHFDKEALLRENGRSYRAAWLPEHIAEEIVPEVFDNEQAITYGLLNRMSYLEEE